ncbi:MAG TPA: 50S ribosomal protein L24e, partial [Methanomassiliicoccales archaeon]|nr:50S ribosomal protein L24e [Methanomassiliicoccales archaeon]
MVELRVCSFCGKEIEPGTGKMFIKKDGTVFLFCSNKCSKNMIDMERIPRRTTWTRAYAREKDVRMAGAPSAVKAEKLAEPKPKAERKPRAKKVRAAEARKAEETKPEEAKEAPTEGS